MTVHICDLPALPDLPKTGIDDYLAHPDGGPDKALALIEEAPRFTRPKVAEILADCGLTALDENSSSETMMDALQNLADELRGANIPLLLSAQGEAIKYLKSIKVESARQQVKLALDPLFRNVDVAASTGKDKAVIFEDVQPWGHTVNGAELADKLIEWFHKFLVIPEYADVALALWTLYTWATGADRAIRLEMRRKLKTEQVARFRIRKVRKETLPLRQQLARWGLDAEARLHECEPALPDELDDRQQDAWEPLLAVADYIGGDWPEKARKAAQILSGASSRSDGTSSIGEQLLADIKGIFEKQGADAIHSDDLCRVLGEMEDRPWPEWRNDKKITARQLASLLKPFGIRPLQIRIGDQNRNGYNKTLFEDAWKRYDLAPVPPKPESPNSTSSTSQLNQQLNVDFDPLQHYECRGSLPTVTHCNQSPVEDVEFRDAGNDDSGKKEQESLIDDAPAGRTEIQKIFGQHKQKREAETKNRRVEARSDGPVCYACQSTEQWRRNGGEWKCAVCHPPEEIGHEGIGTHREKANSKARAVQTSFNLGGYSEANSESAD